LRKGGLPLHGALIERDGTGVLLIGSGGTGKSTCSRRIPDPWRALADDEAIVLPAGGAERGSEARYLLHPLPTWSDYLLNRSHGSWDVRRTVPLRAFFFLERAEKDSVHPVGQGNAAVLLNQSASQVMRRKLEMGEEPLTPAVRKDIFNTAGELAVMVPAYRLKVSLRGRFWEEIGSVLGE